MLSSEIIFIGTGSAKASLKRFHSSFFIKTENFNLLVDAGDGISKALVSQKIDFNSIDGIIISHFHSDHYSGLMSLITQMKMFNREKELFVFVNKGLINHTKNLLTSSYIFLERLGFKINFVGFAHEEVIHINDNFNFLSKQNSHLDDYIKYDKQHNLNFSSSSFLFKLNKEAVFYTGDIASKQDLYLFKDFKIDYMISEITHINLEDIILAFNQLDAKKLYLTHISDEDEVLFPKLLSVSSNKGKIVAAYEGLIFEV